MIPVSIKLFFRDGLLVNYLKAKLHNSVSNLNEGIFYKMIKAILLDFNGVIINDEPLHMKAYQEILSEEGIALSDENYYSCMGMEDKTFINAQYKRAEKEVSPEKIDEIMRAKTGRWRELVAEEIPLFDGMENFIRKMEKEFALGIVSMARRKELE